MHSITLRLAAATFALAAATTSAYADTVIFPGYAHGSESVGYNLNYGVGSPLNVSGSAGAGGFLTSLNGGTTFETYCEDLYQTISFNTLYSDYTAPGTSHAFHNANAYTDLGRLYATAGVINNSVLEAAFQIAAWEIAYEDTGTPYSLTSGAATFTGGSAVTSQANTWLTTLTAGSHPNILVIESRGEQDVIYAPVPEPETYALFMAGLAAMGFVARRRRG